MNAATSPRHGIQVATIDQRSHMRDSASELGPLRVCLTSCRKSFNTDLMLRSGSKCDWSYP
jgi:hypothetical protein